MKITASKFVVRGDIFRLTVPLNAEHSPEAEGEVGQKNRSEKSVRKTGLKTGLKTSLETKDLILEVLRQSSNSTIADLMKATKLSRNGVKWHLENLKSSGRIRRVGPDKGGHWEVME